MKFPVSKSLAEAFTNEVETLEDQTGLRLLLLWSTRFPFLMERTDELSLRGVSLFATHTMVCSEILLYHIPRYRVLESGWRVKKPSANVPRSLETKTSPSLIEWFSVMVSSEWQKG